MLSSRTTRCSSRGCGFRRRLCPRRWPHVLVVVRDRIVEREAVVGGDEVDARVRLAACSFVQVAPRVSDAPAQWSRMQSR